MKRIVLTFFTIMFSLVLGTVVLATTGIVKTDKLNVRDGASTNANAIGTLDKNKRINIISEEEGWYKIQYNDKEGYVSKNYVEENETTNSTDNNESTYENDSKNETNLKTKQKLLNDVDLYVLPLLNSTKLTTLKKDTEIIIISNNGKWVYVQADDDCGWIISKKIDYTQDEEDASEEEANVVENEITNTDADNNETLNNEVNTNDTTEQKTSEETSNTDKGEYPVTMYVVGDSVNIRSSASTTATVISGTAKNASIKVIAKEGDWYKVDTEDGIGYIKSNLLSNKKN